MDLKQIEARLLTIKGELNAENADIDALTKETDELISKRSQKLSEIETRRATLQKVANLEIGKVEKGFEKEELKMEKLSVTAHPEYRTAFFKRLMGLELNDIEKRSINTGNVSAAIPETTANDIITKIKKMVPMLNEITLLHISGNVKFAVEGNRAAAELHTENGELTAATDTLVTVSLSGYEVCKFVRISDTVNTMTINDFERWLTDMLAEDIARKIEILIINGDGENMPKGIAALTFTDGVNGVDWAGTNPTYAELCELISYLPAGYDSNAKWLMNKKMFWNRIQSIRDDGKAKIVHTDLAGNNNILGYPVLLSDYVADDTAYLGDFKKVVGNLSKNINVKASEHSGFAYNAIDYRGTAIFDCDIALSEAFVKLFT